MNFLVTYIDFSIKYKLLVGNNLNEDIRVYIWKIYKRLIAKDILIDYFNTLNIVRCRDCKRPNWGSLRYPRQRFYYVGACNNEEHYFTDIPCCMKYICSRQCIFKITCEKCKNKIEYRPPNLEEDIGWNHIEGKKFIPIICNICNYTNIKNLIWNEKSHEASVGNYV
jgi:hypothetical protein